MGLKLKRLGICLAAVLALSLVVTSISSAAKFTSSSYPASFSGVGKKGTWKFTTEIGYTECRVSSEGVLSEASSTVTVTNASPSECTTFVEGLGSQPTTAKPEGCDSLLHVTSGSGDTYTGTGDLVCPGAGITSFDSMGACEVRIPPQTGTVSLKFTNNTAEGYVTGEVTSSNVTYNVIKDTAFCPYKGTGTKSGGTITQTEQTRVKLEGKTVDIG